MWVLIKTESNDVMLLAVSVIITELEPVVVDTDTATLCVSHCGVIVIKFEFSIICNGEPIDELPVYWEPTASLFVLLVSSHANIALGMVPSEVGKYRLQPPSFCGKPIPCLSGTKRIKLL